MYRNRRKIEIILCFLHKKIMESEIFCFWPAKVEKAPLRPCIAPGNLLKYSYHGDKKLPIWKLEGGSLIMKHICTKFVAMLLVIAMIAGVLPFAFAANVGPFTDVKDTDWFASNVQYVYDNGLMNL